MNSDEERLFQMYLNKSENVLRDRNNFFAIFLSALIALFMPLTLNEINPVIHGVDVICNSTSSVYHIAGQLTSNRFSTSANWLIFLALGLMAIVILVYLFFELKYREYRKNYQTIKVRAIVRNIFKDNANPPTTFQELCDIVEDITSFSKKHIMPILIEYYNKLNCLFSWDEIPGNDNDKFIEFLKKEFGIDWVRTAEIEKIDNGNTIKVSTKINHLSLNLNQEKTEVFFKIDDDRTGKFITKMQNGKLKIYKKKTA